MSAINELPRHRLSVKDFHKMGAAGILDEDDRVELVEGEILDMAPIGSNHAGVVGLLLKALIYAAGDKAMVNAQNPISLGEHSEPQPDILVLRPRQDFYRKAHPSAADVLLLIEVCETSASLDRQVKLPLYARHGVAEVWLIDLANACVDVHREPQSATERYANVRTLRSGSLACKNLPELAIDLKALF